MGNITNPLINFHTFVHSLKPNDLIEIVPDYETGILVVKQLRYQIENQFVQKFPFDFPHCVITSRRVLKLQKATSEALKWAKEYRYSYVVPVGNSILLLVYGGRGKLLFRKKIRVPSWTLLINFLTSREGNK